MDQNKTGIFLKELRKEKDWTQSAFAERLGVSEKTVSKWETGRGLPDISLMLPVCRLLGITVNELLAGERLSTDEQYRAQAEEQLLRFARDRTRPETKAVICNVAAWAGIVVCGALILIASFCDLPVWARITVIVCAFLGVAAVIAPILVVAVDTEMFTCPKCNKEFVPTLTAYLFAPHTIKRRYLKCPYCSQKSWCISRLRSSAAAPRAGREERDQ